MRAEEVALLAKHAFAVAQAFHSYYQKPRYSVLHAESEDARAFRVLVVDAFVRQMDAPHRAARHPRPGAHVRRPARSASPSATRTRTTEIFALRDDYVRAVETAGGLPLVLAPGPAGGRRRDLLDRLDGLVLTGGADVDPALYGEAPPRDGRRASSRERDAFELALCREALRAGPARSSLSAAATRC